MPDLLPGVLSADRWAPMAVAGAAVLQAVPDSTVVCVSLYHIRDVELPAAWLRMLEHPGVVPLSRCPRTYARMIVTVDSLGRDVDPPRPAGQVDPIKLQLFHPEPGAPDHAWVMTMTGRGLGGMEMLCTVNHGATPPRAWCRQGRSVVHE